MVLPGVAPYFHPGYYGPYHYAAGQHPYYGNPAAAAAHTPFPVGPVGPAAVAPAAAFAAHSTALAHSALAAAAAPALTTTTTTFAPAAHSAVAPPVVPPAAGALVPGTAAAAAALAPYHFGAHSVPFAGHFPTSVTTTESHTTSFGQTTTVHRSL